jgi:hypothetical protein
MADKLQDVYREGMKAPTTPHLTDEMWEALAMGEMPAAARDTAMDHIVSCAACSTTYRALRDLEQGASALDAPIVPRATERPAYTKWYALAATLAVIVIGATTYRMAGPPGTTDPPPQASQRPTPTRQPRPAIAKAEVRVSAERSLRVRGAQGDGQFLDDFATAIVPYREDRFAEAARTLADLAAKYPDASEPPFYQGVALLLSGNAAAAVAPLTRAETLAPPSLKPDILRYLAEARALTSPQP